MKKRHTLIFITTFFLLITTHNANGEYFEENDEIFEEDMNYDFYLSKCEDSRNKSDSTTCRRIINNITNTELKCSILLDCKACQLDTGFLQYLYFLLCRFEDKATPTVLLVFWLLILLMCFATIADEFFSPCLIALARTLRMNQNLAGVTLLAFGNGAPDVFSAITAITSGGPDNPDEGLGLGFLLGSGFLVNTVAAGGVIMLKPFKLFRRPFLKDILFYMTAVSWSASILIRRKMTIFDSIGFLCLYTLYVITTWASGAIRKKSLKEENSIIKKIFNKFEAIFHKAEKEKPKIVPELKPGSVALTNIVINDDTSQPTDDSKVTDFKKMDPKQGFTNPAFQITDYESDSQDRRNEDLQTVMTNDSTRNRRSFQHRSHSRMSVDHELPYLVRWIIAHEQDDDNQSVSNEKTNVPKTSCAKKAQIDRTSSINVPNLQKLQTTERRLSENPRRNSSFLSPSLSSKRLSEDHNNIPEEDLFKVNTDIEQIIKNSSKPVNEPCIIEHQDSDRASTDNFDEIKKEKPTIIDRLENWACQNIWNHFIFCIIPVDISNWPNKGVLNKIFSVIRSPLIFIFRLTVPIVFEELIENEKQTADDNEAEERSSIQSDSDMIICTANVLDEEAMHGWCKVLNCLHCITCPMIWTLLLSQGQGQSFGLRYIGNSSIHVVTVAFIVGSVVAGVVFLTSRWYKPPSLYHRPLYASIGFVTSIIWIYALANEFVNALESLGIVWEISEAILGLIVMAMASSIGDIMSNILLARNGYPRIAYTACLGSPIFNLLFGAGLPYTVKIVSGHGQEAIFSFTLTQAVLFAVLLFVLTMNVVVAVISDWTFPRWYSGVLLSIYVSFIVFALLVEADIIVAPVSWNLITGVEP